MKTSGLLATLDLVNGIGLGTSVRTLFSYSRYNNKFTVCTRFADFGKICRSLPPSRWPFPDICILRIRNVSACTKLFSTFLRKVALTAFTRLVGESLSRKPSAFAAT